MSPGLQGLSCIHSVLRSRVKYWNTALSRNFVQTVRLVLNPDLFTISLLNTGTCMCTESKHTI